MYTFKQFIVEVQFNHPSFNDISQLMAQYDHLQENPNEQNLKDFIVNWGQPFKTFITEAEQLANRYDFNSLNDTRPARFFNRFLRTVTSFSKDLASFHNVKVNEMEPHIFYYRDTLKSMIMQIRTFIDDTPKEIQSLLNEFINYANSTLPLFNVVKQIPAQITTQEWPF